MATPTPPVVIVTTETSTTTYLYTANAAPLPTSSSTAGSTSSSTSDSNNFATTSKSVPECISSGTETNTTPPPSCPSSCTTCVTTTTTVTVVPSFAALSAITLATETETTFQVAPVTLTSVAQLVVTITSTVTPAKSGSNAANDPPTTPAPASQQIPPSTSPRGQGNIAPQTITGPGSLPVVVQPSSAIVIDGITITPGSSAATIHGTPVSLAPGGSYLVIGSSTVMLKTSASPGHGSMIWSGLGGSATGSPGYQQFLGGADKSKGTSWLSLAFALGIGVAGMWIFR
jgi:hypothetical protein